MLAVVLACLVWYASALDRRERISERQLDTAVTLVNVPPDMVITSEVPRFLSLRVRGPLSRLRSLDPVQTGVVIDLRGAGEGQRDFPVETRNVVVPAGVEVLAVSPSQVPLRLERLGRRRVPMRARVVGRACSRSRRGQRCRRTQPRRCSPVPAFSLRHSSPSPRSR